MQDPGCLGCSGVEPLSLNQGVILESWNESHTGLLVGSLFLSLPNFLPLSLSLSLSLALSLSHTHTIINNIIIKKQHPSVRCLLDAHLRPIDTNRLKVRGQKIIYDANRYQKKDGGPILISDK